MVLNTKFPRISCIAGMVSLVGFVCLSAFAEPDKAAKVIGSEEVKNLAEAPAPDITDLAEKSGEDVFAQVCGACHGPEGQGNAGLKSPSIAGMPPYYLLSQFEKFRNGKRGTDPHHVPGMQMRAIALAIEPKVIEKVATYIKSMDSIPTEDELGGDWKKGKIEYAERCMECHRFNGKGEIVFGSPPLVNLPDWYLFEQIQHFRDDRRGADETDEGGRKMRQATDGLSDENIKDIVAYIAELAAGRQPKGSIWR